VTYSPGRLFRQETYALAVPFQAEDYLVADVLPADSLEGESGPATPDPRFTWKRCNKLVSGSALILRSIPRRTFESTYRTMSAPASTPVPG
jgi:hypothetical protein